MVAVDLLVERERIDRVIRDPVRSRDVSTRSSPRRATPWVPS
ncbi:hypothetical protein [Nonomuraea dietziae]